jgi:peptidoglycan/LPS O-acetylase OafA/YrhL
MVLAFHAAGHMLPGGFAGVDVFFVISGFLISGIILDALRRGSFSFSWFYARRGRRILPALLLVMFAALPLVCVLLPPDQVMDFGRQMRGASFFSANFLLWKDAGYFDSAAMEKPLRHLWSLAVEEQFYLIWPLLLCLLYRRGKWIKTTLAALILISFAANVLRIRLHPDEVFYLLPARLWELAAGGMLAQLAFERTTDNPPATSPSRGAAAEAFYVAAPPILLVSFLVFFFTAPFPGLAALLPVSATCIYIAAGPDSFWNRLLSKAPCVYIGRISYPLYLWHWPLLSLAYIRWNGAPSIGLNCILAAVSFPLAMLTYHWVEKPAKTKLFTAAPAARKNRLWITAGISGLLLSGLTGTAAIYWSSYGNKLCAYADYRTRIERDICYLPFLADTIPQSCLTPAKQPDKLVFVWGDSFAQRIAYGLRNSLAGKGMEIRDIGASGCPPATELAIHPNVVCGAVNGQVLDFINRLKPGTVILAGNWATYLRNTFNCNPAEFLTRFAATVAELKRAGIKNIIIAGQTPVWKEPLYRNLLSRGTLAQPERIAPSPETFSSEKTMKGMAAKLAVPYAELLPLFCDDGDCRVNTSYGGRSELVVFDKAHLTDTAAEYAADKAIMPLITGKPGGGK